LEGGFILDMVTLRMRQVIYSSVSLALVAWLLVASSGAARAQATTPTPPADSEATVDPARGIVAGDTWDAPANISRSGAASRPKIVADTAGNLHVVWWDAFAGAFYASYSPATGWTNPVAVPQLIGARPLTQNEQPTAYEELSLLADSRGVLHAFFRNSLGNVMYSQARADIGAWTQAIQLATGPVQWDASIDADGGLHLAYIRAADSAQLPAGVYYRQSVTRGGDWKNTQIIQSSLYFRALSGANSFVDLTTPGAGQVLVTWDDPRIGQSYTALSTDNGTSFNDPVAVGGDQADLPHHAYLLPQTDGTLLRLWSPPDSCALFQQVSDATFENWTAPVRVLEDMPGCLVNPVSYALPDGRLALFATLSGGPAPLVLVLWDGTRWSAPAAPRINFVDPATNRSTTLDCVTAILVGEQVSVAGCDAVQDIWTTTSLVNLPDLLPAVSTDWSPPKIISALDASAGLPSLSVDSEGRLHTIWAQAQLTDNPQETVAYARLEGDTWSAPNTILVSPGGGSVQDPATLIDLGGHLHTLWGGGPTGQLFYTRAFARDASGTNGWQAIAAFGEAQRSGSSPALSLSRTGQLYLAYSVPLNEGRGVYFSTSVDQGDSWSPPSQVFDAEEAGWASVQQTAVVVDNTGRVHVAWVQGALPPASAVLGIYYAWSDDDGQTWSAPRVVASGDAGYPTLVVSSDDQVHLLWVSNLLETPQLWHARLPADSENWSEPKLVPGVRDLAPQVGVAADGEGGLHLVGVERTVSDSTVLFYINWDGSRWDGRETIPLGYSVDNASGARAVILPQGKLGVAYRVYTLVKGGGRQYLDGYVERPIANQAYEAPPTFTPPPEATLASTGTPEPTTTPSPTPDLNATPTPPLDGANGLRVGAILFGMVAVVGVALFGLRARRG
jgi:hypothetical protein